MSDRIFPDSNILIYCYTNSDPRKQSIARTLAAEDNVCVSTQVLNETINVLRKKYAVSWNDIETLIIDFENNFHLHQLSVIHTRKSSKIADRYKFSFYDGLIIAASIECKCSVLYSYDLQHSQTIENISILNPFL